MGLLERVREREQPGVGPRPGDQHDADRPAAVGGVAGRDHDARPAGAGRPAAAGRAREDQALEVVAERGEQAVGGGAAGRARGPAGTRRRARSWSIATAVSTCAWPNFSATSACARFQAWMLGERPHRRAGAERGQVRGRRRARTRSAARSSRRRGRACGSVTSTQHGAGRGAARPAPASWQASRCGSGFSSSSVELAAHHADPYTGERARGRGRARAAVGGPARRRRWPGRPGPGRR